LPASPTRFATQRPAAKPEGGTVSGGKKRRFPSDIEFRDALETRDVYAMRSCAYLLDRLENDSKEKIDTSTFTIEHVLPQNENLMPAWREMLGTDWKRSRKPGCTAWAT
jgi:hypothetical protein